MLEINFVKSNAHVLSMAILLLVYYANVAAEPPPENPWTIRCETPKSYRHNSCIMYQEILLFFENTDPVLGALYATLFTWGLTAFGA